MKEIGKVIKEFNVSTSKANSERASIIEEFVKEINEERKDTKYKELPPAAIAVKLAHLKKKDLYPFLKQCRVYKTKKGSFSKCFFGALKSK